MRKANDREIKKLAPLRSTISPAAGAITISLPMPVDPSQHVNAVAQQFFQHRELEKNLPTDR